MTDLERRPDADVRDVWRVFMAAWMAAFVTIAILTVQGWNRPLAVPPSREVRDAFLPPCQHLLRGRELDRELFLTGLLLYPTALLAFSLLPFKLPPRWFADFCRRNVGSATGVRAVACSLGIASCYGLWLFCRSWHDLEQLPETAYAWPGSLWCRVGSGIALWPVAAMVLAGKGLRCVSEWQSRVIARIGIAVTLAGLFLTGWFARDQLTTPIHPHHFNAVYHATVQVCLGRPLLVGEHTHQYGLYPLFLRPIFQLVGHDVGTFTFVMQLLKVIGWLCVLAATNRLLSRKCWSVLAWLTALYCVSLMPLGRSLGALPLNSMNTYLQWDPIRMVFPSLLIFLLSDEKWFDGWRGWLAHVAMAIGLLWNLDTGLVAWLTWSVVHWHRGVCRYGWRAPWLWIRHGIRSELLAVAALSIVMSAVTIFYRTQRGEMPDFMQAGEYQKIFFGAGFYMAPMKLWEVWQVPICLYGIGIACGLYATRACDTSTWSRSVFGLSIMGVGLFAYFNGNSNSITLVSVLCPAILIGAMMLERLDIWMRHNVYCRGARRFAAWLPLIVASGVASQAAGGTLFFIPRFWKNIEILQTGDRSESAGSEAAFLRRWCMDGPTPFVLSFNRSGELYSLIGRPMPVNMPALVEVILWKQLKPFDDYLREGNEKRIVVDLQEANSYTGAYMPFLDRLKSMGAIPLAVSAQRTLALWLIQAADVGGPQGGETSGPTQAALERFHPDATTP